MPLAEMRSAITNTGCRALVLSGLIDPASSVLKQELPSLAEEVDVPIFAGGQISVRVFDALKRMGIEPLGVEVDLGLSRLQEQLPLQS